MSCQKTILLVAAIVCTQLISAQKNKQPTAKELVSKMTLDEKVHLLVGMGMKMPAGISLPDGSKTQDGPVVGETLDKVEGAAGTTYAIPRLNIPSMVVADGPAGVRISPVRKGDANTYYATAFPVGTALASTWDTALVKKVGAAMGNEVLEYGVDILLAPALNIHRNPLGGRNFEYYSEDPIVSGHITAAMVNGIQSQHVGTSIKHYAANNQETNRNTINTIVSERALREIYLRGFEIAVKQSNPWTVMSSYNKINGVYTSESYELLSTILRKEWGYKGFVMTDWFGGKDAVAQMKAGNELLMPGTPTQTKTILEAVASNKLDEKIITQNAERIVEILLKTSSYNHYVHSNKPDLKAHAEVVRLAAAEGMVLLRNQDKTLPLAGSGKKLAVFGNSSFELIAGGTGSGDVNKAYSISLEEGLKNAGFIVNADLKTSYTTYVEKVKATQPKKRMFFEPVIPIDEMKMDATLAAQQANDNDAALITIGRSSGEFVDRKLENDFNLSANEMELIQLVSEAFHAKGKKVMVLLNIGGVIETASWNNKVDAILLGWQPGQEGGNSVADIVTGKINPSGKLATTFPISYQDVPSAKNFPGKELTTTEKPAQFSIMRSVPSEVTYEEGVYVGYRYYNSFKVATAYPFGYGLSYTSFKYSNLKLNATQFNKSIKISVDITNTGMVAGKEVVQLYLSAPAVKLNKPEAELKAFGKTNLLQPGATQTLEFVLQPKDLASFDSNLTAWVAEAGNYTVKLGSSSADTKQTGSFVLAKELVVEKNNKVLVPQVTINELKK